MILCYIVICARWCSSAREASHSPAHGRAHTQRPGGRTKQASSLAFGGVTEHN